PGVNSYMDASPPSTHARLASLAIQRYDSGENLGGYYEAHFMAGRCFSAGLLCSRARATGQDRDSRGYARRSSAGSDFERARYAEEGGDVPGFPAEVFGESRGRCLWQLADIAVLPDGGRSAESPRLRRQGFAGCATQPGYSGVASRHCSADEGQCQAL